MAEKKAAKITIVGNQKVGTDAITDIISLKVGGAISKEDIAEDIRSLYNLGYFSHIAFYRQATSDPELFDIEIEVKEKPAISKISFEGLNEISEDDIQKAMLTKLYSIINESTVVTDTRMIEKKYAEKGFYLAKVNYLLKPNGQNEVDIVFQIEEQGKLLIGDVTIVGNHYFTTASLLELMMSKPHTRWSSTLGQSSLYQDMIPKRDVDFLNFYYRDHGFADVKVNAKPVITIDNDRQYVRITYELEEGDQFYVGNIKVTGDIGPDLYEEPYLKEQMKLEKGKLFKYSHLRADIDKLNELYGALGYAFVDINPLTNFDRAAKTVDLNYVIDKGKKVYFGKINITGNVKTRDNVIRRELKFSDSELYNGIFLNDSQKNIQSLGFFEEVKIIKNRDEKQDDLLNVNVEVKGRPTGQLNATFSYTPTTTDTTVKAAGQLRYDEKNQSGRGWAFNLTGKFSNKENYLVSTEFFNPRLNDSLWSFGISLSLEEQLKRYTSSDVEVPETEYGITVSGGRQIFEKWQLSTSLTHNRIHEKERRADSYLFENYRTDGVRNTLGLAVSYRDLNNHIDPSEGMETVLRQKIIGGFLGGDFTYLETSGVETYFKPIDFTERFRTYFKLQLTIGKLWTIDGSDLPDTERYRLGGPYDLRGFSYKAIGPSSRRLLTPGGDYFNFNEGGHKKALFQMEYFIPLIDQAGIKGILFTDWGQTFHESQSLDLRPHMMERDVGFGIRWITPIAPFRFEAAFPWRKETGKLGGAEIIVNIGY
jgi:outer membrane protein insertion porin family